MYRNRAYELSHSVYTGTEPTNFHITSVYTGTEPTNFHIASKTRYPFNDLPNDKILNLPKFKAFADYKISVTYLEGNKAL